MDDEGRVELKKQIVEEIEVQKHLIEVLLKPPSRFPRITQLAASLEWKRSAVKILVKLR